MQVCRDPSLSSFLAHAGSPDASAVIVTSLFAQPGKRSWERYVPWLSRIFSLESRTVFFGDQLTTSMVKANSFGSRASRHFITTVSFEALDCHSWDSLYHSSMDGHPGHTEQASCLWHQKIFFLRRVITCSSDAALPNSIWWVDAGAFRFPVPFHRWPSQQRVQLLPSERVLLHLAAPISVEMLRWWRHAAAQSATDRGHNATFLRDHVVMSARVFGGKPSAVAAFCSLYMAQMEAVARTPLSLFVHTEAAVMTMVALAHPEKVALLVADAGLGVHMGSPESVARFKAAIVQNFARPLASRRHPYGSCVLPPEGDAAFWKAGLAWSYIDYWLASPSESNCSALNSLLLPTKAWVAEPLRFVNAQARAMALPATVVPLPVALDWREVQSPQPLVVHQTSHGFRLAAPGGLHEKKDHPGLTEHGRTLANHWEFTLLWEHLLDSKMIGTCGEAEPLVVDVGMNLGFYTLLARTRCSACRTVGFEIVRKLHPYIKASLDANALDRERTTLYGNAVTNTSNAAFTVTNKKASDQNAHVVTTSLSSRSSQLGLNMVRGVRFDELVQRPVYLMKIDVEGQEVNVLEGALGLFKQRAVRYVTVEFGGVTRWARGGKTAHDASVILRRIARLGYSLWVIEMWKQPSTKFIQPTSPSFWPRFANWPRRVISTGRAPPADAFSGGCPRVWCHLDGAGRVVGFGDADHSQVTLIEILDVDALVAGPLAEEDFNLLFERRSELD